MPHNYAFSVFEDSQGSLWLGPNGYLSQFKDGIITNYPFHHGRPESGSIAEDRAGNLWISTPGHGLTLTREGRFRTFDKRDGLADDEVTALYEGRSG